MMVSLSDKLLLATAALDVYLGLDTLEQCVNSPSEFIGSDNRMPSYVDSYYGRG